MGDWNSNEDTDNEDDTSITSSHIIEAKIDRRDGKIYLIDAHIFNNSPVQFELALKCIETSILNGLTNDKDLAGIVFYNTLYNPLPMDSNILNEETLIVPANVAIFFSFKPHSKQRIQYFRDFTHSIDFLDFSGRYGTVATSHLSDALALCLRIFMNVDNQLYASSIVVFTNNEQPHALDSIQLQEAFQCAQDMSKNGIDIIVVPTVDTFDMEPFFKQLCCIATDTDLEAFRSIPPKDQRQLLLNGVHQRHYRSMLQRYLNVTLADGLEFACGIYSFVREKQTFELKLAEKDKWTFRGGESIKFTAEEYTDTRSLIPPGIRVLGFKPLEQLGLADSCFLKQRTVLYPAEDHIEGSSTLFRALWEKCLEKQKYIFCVLTHQRGGPSRYVALVPQTKEAHTHDCFQIVCLPMTRERHDRVFDNIRKIRRIDPHHESMFNILCKALNFEYKPFASPRLQLIQSKMEVLSFDDTTTLPNTALQESLIQDYISELPPGIEPFQEKFAVKRRPGEKSVDETCPKAPKKDLTDEEIELAIREGKGEIASNRMLQNYLKSNERSFKPNIGKRKLIQIIQQMWEEKASHVKQN